jgi:non-ribosomal peptide synthase protein (TIGR01720 family)
VQTIQAEQGIVTGPVPLTPIQRWFFEREMPELHQFNQAMLLELRETIDPALLARSIDYLLRHHDALRLRCQQDDDGWQQWIAPPDALLPLNHIDLSMLSQPEQAAAIERSAAELIGRLHLTSGPLLQVALFELGADVPQRLLIVLHHLAVDGVSWRLLLEDLEHAYRQLMRDGKIALPAKTTSFKQWSERLSEYAQSPELRQELPYWLATAANFARLPVDEIEPGAASAHEPVVSTLDQAETNALLHDVPAAYRTQINDVLLAALAHTISEWTGEHTLLVHLEGHGREALFDDVDLSRTVGWFTTSFPLCLDLGWSDTLEEQLKRVKEQLRQLPQRGIGYGMLRYLSRDPEVGAALQALPHPEISLNYLGQYDQVIGASELFGIVQESDSPYQSMRGSRSNLIEINGLVIGGRLQLEWTYDEQIHRPATIARLARRFEAALRSLIAGAFTPAAVAYTP